MDSDERMHGNAYKLELARKLVRDILPLEQAEIDLMMATIRALNALLLLYGVED